METAYYWVQHVAGAAYALTITQGMNNFVRLTGAGFAGDKAISGGVTGLNNSNSTSELVSADPVTPIVSGWNERHDVAELWSSILSDSASGMSLAFAHRQEVFSFRMLHVHE
jgi:hypothetical protein